MEQNIGLVVLEHLRYQFHIHVLDVDFLQILVQHHDRFIEFLLTNTVSKFTQENVYLTRY